MAALINTEGPFHIWDRPAAFPQADLVSGVPDEPVFDLGVDLDGKDGAAYIRVDHVIAMARTLGMVTKEEHDESAETIGKLLAERDETEVGRLTNAIASLDSYVRDNLGTRDNPPVLSVEDSAEPESAEPENGGDFNDSDESAVVEGPDELSGSTNNDPFGFDSLGQSDTKSS